MNGIEDSTSVIAETDVAVDVADFLDRVADNFLHIDVVTRANFASNDDLTGCHQRFDRNASISWVGIVCQNVVNDGIRDLVGNLVGMTHADRFTCK